jgi:hypothetical protein
MRPNGLWISRETPAARGPDRGTIDPFRGEAQIMRSGFIMNRDITHLPHPLSRAVVWRVREEHYQARSEVDPFRTTTALPLRP